MSELCSWCEVNNLGCESHRPLCCLCADIPTFIKGGAMGAANIRLEQVNRARAQKKKGPLEIFEGALRPARVRENEFGPITL